MVQKQSTLKRTGKDISTDNEIIAKTNTPGDALVSINIEGTADAGYAVDVADKDYAADDDWFQGEETYAIADQPDPQDIRDTFYVGDAWIRVRVTDPAAAGETADVTIQKAH